MLATLLLLSLPCRLSQFKTLENRVASILDPRVRKTGEGSERDEQAEQEVRRLVAVETTLEDASPQRQLQLSSDEATPPSSPPEKKFLAFLDDEPRQQAPGSASTTAVDSFLQTPRNASVDPMVFWREQAGGRERDAKQLALVACNVLGVPATSAPSERLFSVAGNVSRPRRSTIGCSLFEKVVLLSANRELLGN